MLGTVSVCDAEIGWVLAFCRLWLQDLIRTKLCVCTICAAISGKREEGSC